MADNVVLTDEDIAEAQAAGYAAHIAHCDVVRLRKLETEARKLQGKLWAVESQWNRTYIQICNTPQFSADCEARGIVGAYRFTDVLC